MIGTMLWQLEITGRMVEHLPQRELDAMLELIERNVANILQGYEVEVPF